MVNRYLLTDEIIKKYLKEVWKKYIVLNLIVDIIYIFLIFYCYLYFNNNSFLIYILFGFLMMYIVFWKRNRAIKTEIERMRIRYGEEPPYMTVELREEIIIAANENSMSIPYDKVIKYIQTEELVLIKIKGKMYAILKKDSFVEGTYEECIALLDKICS